MSNFFINKEACRKGHKKAFTLVELLLVIAILGIIASVSQGFYSDFVQGTILSDNAQSFVFDLRGARNKAMVGEADSNWGLLLVNGSDDYYEIFSSPTDYSDLGKTVEATIYLRDQAFWLSPTEGNNQEIVFSKISGVTSMTESIIGVSRMSKIVSVNSQGLIE